MGIWYFIHITQGCIQSILPFKIHEALTVYMECEDTIVNSVIKKFKERSDLGKKKYGVTLDRTDLATLDWINHAQEELMDGILYLEKLKKSFDSTASK
jgi:hypothetical protein